MHTASIHLHLALLVLNVFAIAFALPPPSQIYLSPSGLSNNITPPLFHNLEELSRLVDIAYCVGLTPTNPGITRPFQCASRCDEFPTFQLVDTFNTGPLMSDSCGYIALDHGSGTEGKGRIVVAFRGTYSIANTIVDLSTKRQEYVPYPEDPESDSGSDSDATHRGKLRKLLDWISHPFRPLNLRIKTRETIGKEGPKCTNCTVHSGFLTSWQNTRPYILPHLHSLHQLHPSYEIHLVGHSLGGAVAALAGLEISGFVPKWKLVVTTFGEPRIGNEGLREFMDGFFGQEGQDTYKGGRYRRVTHVDDPVPLLPLKEWGYVSHGGEIYISKSELQPDVKDVRFCEGDEDSECSESGEDRRGGTWFGGTDTFVVSEDEESDENIEMLRKRWGLNIPTKYKLWQLFFAHRDYFWRLGLCLPGGDPLDWNRPHYNITGVREES